MTTRKPKELIRMRPFNEAQREQIKEWLEDHTYAKTAELIQTEYQHEVPPKTLERYYHRNAPLRELEAKAELGEAAIAFLNHAVDGSAAFEPAAIEAIKQHAFKLAMTKEDFGQLKGCFQIIHGDKRLALHSRRLDLEERRIILKEPPLPKAKDPTEVHEKRWDEWGMPEANRAFFRKEILDDMARQEAIRNLGHNPNPTHKIPPVGRVPDAASQTSGGSEGQGEGSPAASTTNVQPVPDSRLKTQDPRLSYKCPIDALWLECGENKEKFVEAFTSKLGQRGYSITHLSSPDWSKEKNEAFHLALLQQDAWHRQRDAEESARRAAAERASAQPVKPSEASCESNQAAMSKTDLQPTHPGASLSLLKGEGCSAAPVPIDSRPRTQDSRLSHQNALAYSHARAEEYCAYGRSITPWPHRQHPPRYKTKLIQCPCGFQLPCPHHEEFPDSFWFLSPFSPDYAQALLHRNLPCPNLQGYAA